jgi:hypothetical protein
MRDGPIFIKTFRASLFNDDLSNDPIFGWIHLAEQYLYAIPNMMFRILLENS